MLLFGCSRSQSWDEEVLTAAWQTHIPRPGGRWGQAVMIKCGAAPPRWVVKRCILPNSAVPRLRPSLRGRRERIGHPGQTQFGCRVIDAPSFFVDAPSFFVDALSRLPDAVGSGKGLLRGMEERRRRKLGRLRPKSQTLEDPSPFHHEITSGLPLPVIGDNVVVSQRWAWYICLSLSMYRHGTAHPAQHRARAAF